MKKVLVANRGEIAIRILRACREMGIRTVAVYSDADREALHLEYADEAVRLGPPAPAESYLNIPRLLEVARQTGCDAVHPGYGFLAENAQFAQAVREAGLIFVGPPPEAIAAMGDKTAARQRMAAAGVPTVPGTLEPVTSVEEVLALGEELGYPLALKAAAGGGGKGFKVVYAPEEVPAALESARREAQNYFGNPAVYVEKYIRGPRHVEIQIFADGHGHVVHLGERDCSIQRRHQKLIEEAPSPAVDEALRQRMGEAAVRAARAVGYVGAGTVEFLLAPDGRFYFLEMNTRIQVEHPVTEMVTGIDLVQEQLRVAAGLPLSFRQEDVVLRGHALECRINAEDPSQNFRPASGQITLYRAPAGPWVRVDSGVGPGSVVPPQYDSLLAKVIVWGRTRAEAIARMERALAEFRIEGVPTTIPFHRLALAHPVFREGKADITFVGQALTREELEALGAGEVVPPPALEEEVRELTVEVNDRRFRVRVHGWPSGPATAGRPGRRTAPRPRPRERGLQGGGDGVVRSPIQGTVVAVKVQEGQEVKAGEVLCIVEAMKMENEIPAPRDGVVRRVAVTPGAMVEAGGVLVELG